MDQATMFLWIITAAGVMCSIFGVLFLLSPQMVHRLNQGISRRIMSFDTTFVKYSTYSGILFLAIGAFLLYMTIQ